MGTLFNEKEVTHILIEGTQGYRKAMDDNNIHVLELSYEAIKSSDPQLTEVEYAELLSKLKGVYPVESSLKVAMQTVQHSSSRAMHAVFVVDRKYGTYLVGGKYSNLQGPLGKLLKDVGSLGVFSEVNKVGQTRANIGHIVSGMIPSTQSPLGNKLLDLASKTSNSGLSEVFLQMYGDLEKAHGAIDVEYAFTREDFDADGFNKILGTGSILVTLQGFARNNALAVGIEAKITRQLTNLLETNRMLDRLVRQPGSNTILEDIKLAVVARISGTKATSKHHKNKPVKQTYKIPSKKKAPVIEKVPPLRNVQGQFYSLTSLQVLINASLQHVISANMGDQPYPGGQRKILNYRTGRFASSANVERLSQSRAGMITAFFSYMKYPYQTFEPGFAQGSPKSRDPKLLISKSIREIAATKVGNRMRAVLV